MHKSLNNGHISGKYASWIFSPIEKYVIY